MRILHVSDLHYNWPWFKWVQRAAPKYSAVCFSGDFADMFNLETPGEQQAGKVHEWLAGFSTPIFVCSGNHDWAPAKAVELANTNFLRSKNPAVRSDGTDELFLGYRFVCLGWGEMSKDLSGDVPVVLLSHAPPGETRLGKSGPGMGDLGELGVRAATESLPPRSIVLSGHVHEPEVWCERVGNAWVFNPGYPSARTEIPHHISLDLDKGIAAFTGDHFWEGHELDVQKLW